MKLAIEIFSILTAFNAALFLQRLYVVQARELHELHKQGFAGGLKHPLSGTDAIAIPPGAVVASDNLKRSA